MKISTRKSVATTIALLLTLTITLTLIALPVVTAQDDIPVGEVKTYCFVAPQPKVGVDQDMFIVTWLNEMPVPETDEERAEGRRGAYYGVSLTIAKPDGTEETVELGPSDPVGNNYYIFTPHQIGTYEVQAHFPGNWRNSSIALEGGLYPAGYDWYTASESEVRTFEVQEDPVPGWDEAPLPEDYWMRPISGASHRWSEVASHWLGSYAQVYPQGASGGATTGYAYGDGPESPHILWTRQHLPMGGIMDERFGAEVWTLSHYQSVRFSGMIVQGKLHYGSAYTPHMGKGWTTLDLYTGEQLRLDYEAEMPDLGQVYLYNSPNQHGGFAYLYRTSGVELPDEVNIAHAELRGPGVQPPKRTTPSETVDSSEITTGTLWEMMDAHTHNTVCYIANVSSGTQVYGKDGSILYYSLEGTPNPAGPFAPDVPPYRLTVWNSSAGTMIGSGDNRTGYWQWRPQGGAGFGAVEAYFEVGVPAMFGTYSPVTNIVHDGNLMYSLNVSVPLEQSASIVAVREGEYLIFGDQGINNDTHTEPAYFMGVSLEDGHEGEKLWETSFTPPYAETWAGGFFGNGMSFTTVVPEEEVIVFSDNIQLKRYGYDMRTGEKLWEGEREAPWKFYSFDYKIYNGMLISGGGYSGELIAYNLTTGEVEWTYEAPLEGTESPYGRGTMELGTFAGGKLYTGCGEHSPSTPLWRQPGLRCIDANTGELIWDILFWDDGSRMIADGILVARSLYDGQVYAFGKGPSETTVSVGDNVVTEGDNVLITGTVTDQTSTGARNVNNELEFTLEGTPAISDEDMREWMEYKFMEQGCPQDAEGVRVTLDAIAPDGEFVHIGATTSGMSGSYSYSWQPDMEGKYEIIATFEGSDSYYASYDQTAIEVAAEVSDGEPANYTWLLVGLMVAVVVAIVIGILNFLAIRRRL